MQRETRDAVRKDRRDGWRRSDRAQDRAARQRHSACRCAASAGRRASGRPRFRRHRRAREIRALFADADYVVMVLPSTPQTAGMVDAAALSALKPTARLINVGRGSTLDQDALCAALRDGRLAGAALDVMRPEPLPADSPLWDVPNLIISPHMSGDHTGCSATSPPCSCAISSASCAASRSSTWSTRARVTSRRTRRASMPEPVRRIRAGELSPVRRHRGWCAPRLSQPIVSGRASCALSRERSRVGTITASMIVIYVAPARCAWNREHGQDVFDARARRLCPCPAPLRSPRGQHHCRRGNARGHAVRARTLGDQCRWP